MIDKFVPEFFATGEYNRLSNAVWTGLLDQPFWRGRRAGIAIYLMMFAGLRISEVCNLCVRHVRLEDRRIIVNGKGGKVRILPICDVLRSNLTVYMRDLAGGSNSPILPAADGSTLSTRSLQRDVKAALIKIKCYRPGITCHSLRHSFATRLYSEGVDLYEIMELLGHSSVTTTQIYAHINPTRLMAAVQRIGGSMDGNYED